jgi:hypothetical protein
MLIKPLNEEKNQKRGLLDILAAGNSYAIVILR